MERKLKESLRSTEYKKLEALFSEAEALFMNFFIRTNQGEGYGGNKTIQPNSYQWVQCVLKVADYMIQLKNLDYYERSLKQKRLNSSY